MRPLLPWLLLGACRREAALLQAQCAPGSHAHTLRCEASLDAPAPTTWTVRGSDGTVRELTRAEAQEVELELWGFAADIDLDWTVRTEGGESLSGSLHTDPLPEGLQQLSLSTQGRSVGLDHFAVPYLCPGAEAGLAVFGTDGQIRWHEPFPVVGGLGPSAGLIAFDWVGSELVVVRDGQRVLRQDALGNVRFDVLLEGPLHHDVALRGDQVLALYAYPHEGRVLDGLYVLDAHGEPLASWGLSDTLSISGQGGGGVFWSGRWPFATDWSHANSIVADGEAHALLSLRWQDALLRIVADPTRSDFGQVDWILTGSEDTDLVGDFAWSDGGGFDGQHHGSRLSNGGIAVFDNGPAETISRVLFMEIDEETRTVREARSWPVGESCPVQGGAYELPGGGALATCSPSGRLLELAPESTGPLSTGPLWSAVLTCQGTAVSGLGRARPVSLPGLLSGFTGQ